jgi:hypothetical protein
MAKKDAVLDALRKASKGVQFPSETEADIEPFAWTGADKLTKKQVLQLAGAGAGAAVEETTLDELFQTVPSEDKPKFDALRQALEGQVSGVKVYKVGGEPEKRVFIVGKAPDGRWAGLKTTVVET